MEKINLLALIAALYALEKNERAVRIKDVAKENNVDGVTLFNALKEVGYNPKAEKGTEAPVPDSKDAGNTGTADNTGAGKITVTLRHTTEYPIYRRVGLVLKQVPAEFHVTEEQLAALEKDKWVEVITKEGAGK